jgi:hypothetical protein
MREMDASLHFRGEPNLKICTEVSAYWSGIMFEHSNAIKHFFRSSMNIVGSCLKWYETETMGTPQQLTSETLDLLDFWLDDERSRRQITTLELESSEDPTFPSDCAFTFKSINSNMLKAGACRLVLPYDFGFKTPDRLLQLATDLFAVDEFNYGLAGFAINWNPRSKVANLAKANFGYLAKRYRGLDIPQLIGTLLTVSAGIKTINWLTILNKEKWDDLDSEWPLANVDAPGIRIRVNAWGTIIQAGPKPLLGDTYKGEKVEAYEVVGRALSSIRCHNHPEIIPAGEGDDAQTLTEEWLGRFD